MDVVVGSGLGLGLSVMVAPPVFGHEKRALRLSNLYNLFPAGTIRSKRMLTHSAISLIFRYHTLVLKGRKRQII